MLVIQFFAQLQPRTPASCDRYRVDQHRHVVDPQRDKVQTQEKLRKGTVCPEEDECAKRSPEQYSTGELGNDDPGTEQGNVNGGEFARIEHGSSEVLYAPGQPKVGLL